MLRRSPQAILTAHRMDRARRELYVEGAKDRGFILWLLGSRMNADSRVLEVGTVDLPGVERGGERGRLLEFGAIIEDRADTLRCFADADWDRVLARKVPTSVWLTDQRDLEGYLWRVECIDKVLRVGLGASRIAAADVLQWLVENGRTVGLLRLVSELDELDLPFQETKLKTHVAFDGSRMTVDLRGFLQALLQNAQRSLAELDPILNRHTDVRLEYASTPDSDLIHGKDAMCLVGAVLKHCNSQVQAEEAARLLWMSFERDLIEADSALDSVRSFLGA